MSESALPIDALRDEVVAAVAEAPLVLGAPTGSGKSTQVPRWLEGRVVVVEPRRVACRSLAQRVAELEGCALGDRVGYRVRDEHRASGETRVLFVTPGIALRDPALLERADAVILDEFHERRLDVDLLFGLLAERARGLVVMSATLDGERIAAHLGGRWLRGEGRLHPVDVRYLGRGAALPSAKDLPARVRSALEAAADDPGDVLVFLPGRAEIAACADALRGRGDLTVLELHGGLSLKEQSRAFARAKKRKVVLATNVAETSVTIPGIGVVIDAGLVRRTRYHRGRGFLTLSPVALDSAEQRAGRAGRTGPGVCYRLWSEAAILEPRTPPEVHRESLTPMLLAAAAAGRRLEALPLLDPPKDYALEAAREELETLGAFDADGGLTELGRQLFAQPLDAPHARLLVEAQGRPELLGDVIDLVSALSVSRPLFVGARPERSGDDLRERGCDVVATLKAVRVGEARRHRLNPYVLREARRTAARLRRAHRLPERAEPDARIDRAALAKLFLRADPRTAHVARRRKRHLAFSNGGTEIELGRESAVHAVADEVEALCVLDTRALGTGRRDTTVIATCAMPVKTEWLRDAGLGRERVGSVRLEEGAVVATVEKVFARRVIDVREETPEGALAREAIVKLLLEGRMLPEARARAEERLQARRLAARLAGAGVRLGESARAEGGAAVPSLEAHFAARVEELGVTSGEDAALLEVEDLLPEDLDAWTRELLDRDYPRTFELGDAFYEIDYDLSRRQVVMRMVRGTRDTAPPLGYLPKFPGFRVCVESRKAMHVVRERRR